MGLLNRIFGRFTVQASDIDGTIWYIVKEHGNPWFESKYKLSRLVFIVKQKTEYADHIEYGPSGIRYDDGPVPKNFDKYLRIYADRNIIEVREKTTFGGSIRYKYKAGENSLEGDMPEDMADEIDDVLSEYLEMSSYNLRNRLIEEYPEYSSSVNKW